MRRVAALSSACALLIAVPLTFGLLMDERTAVALLTVLAGLVTLTGLSWGARNIQREVTDLGDRLGSVHENRQRMFTDFDSTERSGRFER